MVWHLWEYIFPECRRMIVGPMGAVEGSFDWHQVATVIDTFLGIPPNEELFTKLRYCIRLIMVIESEARKKQKEDDSGK